jgi:predicted aspartyl protease
MLCRTTITLFLILSTCLLADTRESELKALFDSHQWFELRDAVSQPGASALYKCAVACAFGDVSQALKEADSVIKSAPRSEQAYQVHDLLANLYLRTGRYGKGLQQLNQMLEIKPDNASDQAGRKVFQALSGSPEQSVGRRGFSKMHYEVKLGNPFTTVSVNGKPAKYMLDTGMNVSAVSESEAKRVGLVFQPVASDATKAQGSAGLFASYRIAVADLITVGNFHIRNVAFLVFPDAQEPWNDLQPGERGALGISVLHAIQTARFSKDGTLEIGFPSKGGSVQQANLCFQGAVPVVAGECGGRRVTLVLDTGAEETSLWLMFAKDFASVIDESGKKDRKQIRGVGGALEIEAVTLPEVMLKIGGFETILRPAPVLLQETLPASKDYHGLLGWTLLQQADQVTFDFKSMKLTLQ